MVSKDNAPLLWGKAFETVKKNYQVFLTLLKFSVNNYEQLKVFSILFHKEKTTEVFL